MRLFYNDTSKRAIKTFEMNDDIINELDNYNTLLEPIACINELQSGTQICNDNIIESFTFKNAGFDPLTILQGDDRLSSYNIITNSCDWKGIKLIPRILERCSNGWSCYVNDMIIINLTNSTSIIGIVTQGETYSQGACVSEYTLDYSVDNVIWTAIINPDSNELLFTGNNLAQLNKSRYNYFNTVTAKYIRLTVKKIISKSSNGQLMASLLVGN